MGVISDLRLSQKNDRTAVSEILFQLFILSRVIMGDADDAVHSMLAEMLISFIEILHTVMRFPDQRPIAVQSGFMLNLGKQAERNRRRFGVNQNSDHFRALTCQCPRVDVRCVIHLSGGLADHLRLFRADPDIAAVAVQHFRHQRRGNIHFPGNVHQSDFIVFQCLH